MKALIVIDINITDPIKYEEYKKLTPATITAYEGRFVVRGTPVEVLEGDWLPGRFVILEFPSLEKAKAWWSSKEYAPAKAMRQQAADTNMIVVEVA